MSSCYGKAFLHFMIEHKKSVGHLYRSTYIKDFMNKNNYRWTIEELKTPVTRGILYDDVINHDALRLCWTIVLLKQFWHNILSAIQFTKFNWMENKEQCCKHTLCVIKLMRFSFCSNWNNNFNLDLDLLAAS